MSFLLVSLSLFVSLAHGAWQAESSFSSSSCDLAKLQSVFVTENKTCVATSVTQQCRGVSFDQWTMRICYNAPPVYPQRRVAFNPCLKALDIVGPRPRELGFYMVPQDVCFAHTSIDKFRVDCTNASAPLVFAPCDAATPAVGGKGVCLPWTSEGALAEFTCEEPNQSSLPTEPASTTAAANETASPTTASPVASSTAALMCAELGAKERPCTRCKSDDRCAWHATLGNALDLGGSCLPKGVDAPAATKEVTSAADCLDTCDDFSCTDCIAMAGCKWCDTGAALGIGSTGSCEKKECTTKAATQTTCSSAAAVALTLAAIVAATATAI